ERPELLKQLVDKHGAKDSTARQTAAAELESMIPRTSQFHPGYEIPEKNLYYRLAKKFLFNDFGVYAGHDHTQSAAPYLRDMNKETGKLEKTETESPAPAN
ncbi:MAG: radical SAM protein, partial [Planctomycetaceae bacterium]|nr:radical SAM protein [Planctomycetaceae bacterium]